MLNISKNFLNNYITKYGFLFITPSLGLLRNYIKYKQLSLLLYLRSPVLTLIIYKLLIFYNKLKKNNYIYLSLILERWIMLIFKSILSIYNRDYIHKKEKYIVKYSLDYT